MQTFLSTIIVWRFGSRIWRILQSHPISHFLRKMISTVSSHKVLSSVWNWVLDPLPSSLLGFPQIIFAETCMHENLFKWLESIMF
jgi:hypothetical protein